MQNFVMDQARNINDAKTLWVKCWGMGKSGIWQECKNGSAAKNMEREEWGEAAKDRNLGKIYAYIEGIKENQDGERN